MTVSEVRPDGNETFVQSGWLDASERKLDAGQSTLLEPVLSERKADARPLPHGRFTEVIVPLYYEGHVYRAGSRIRITISAPGGDQPSWAFSESRRSGHATVMLAPLAIDAVADHPAGRAGRGRPDRLPAVPRPPRRAVPALPAAGQPDGELNSRSSTRATPASSFDAVTSSAAAITSGWALATATA